MTLQEIRDKEDAFRMLEMAFIIFDVNQYCESNYNMDDEEEVEQSNIDRLNHEFAEMNLKNCEVMAAKYGITIQNVMDAYNA